MFSAIVILLIWTGDTVIKTVINDPLPPTQTLSQCYFRGADILKVIYQENHSIVEAKAGCIELEIPKKENNDKVEKDV